VNSAYPSTRISGYKLAGESVPAWLAIALAVLGTLGLAIASWLALGLERTGPALGPADVRAGATAQSVAASAAPAPAVDMAASAVATPASAVAVPAVAASAPPTQASPAPQPPSPAVTAAARPQPPEMPHCPQAEPLLFALGSATLSRPNARADLAAVIEWLRTHRDAKVVVEGHADVVGSDQPNLLLSYRRARAVAAVLAAEGITGHRVQIVAAGSHALLDGVPGNARANRRVMIEIVDPAGCTPGGS
jgi:outer membrane protein OmpA-like peptidoglycan-associated protein